jgi:hypothetical protein
MPHARNIRVTQFFHRKNPDATFDSVCGFCYSTVANTENEDDLRAKETVHRCEERKMSIHLVE